MSACHRVTGLLSVRRHQLLTGTVLQRGAFFSKKDKGGEAQTKIGADKSEGRKISDEENRHTTKHNLGLLKSQRSLDTKRPYKPPSNVNEIVETVVRRFVGLSASRDTASISLEDPKLKYQVLSRLITEFNHDVPNSMIGRMSHISDVIKYFEQEVRVSSSYEDLKTLDLPKNLHIQMDYVRFKPSKDEASKDTLCGRTAFPGRDTIVTSIKYKRKYEDIKTTKEKPGYNNYYYGY